MSKKKMEAGLVDKLREAIKHSGLTLTAVAERSGVALPQITRFVSGERGLSLVTAEKICHALHLTLISEKAPEAP